MSDLLIKAPASRFPFGWTPITRYDEPIANTGIGFAVWRLEAGSNTTYHASDETAFLLMSGRGSFDLDGCETRFAREKLFDDGPYCAHICQETKIRISCDTEVEFSVFTCPNHAKFQGEVMHPEDLPVELRGRDQVDNACLRLVRTILLPSSLRKQADKTQRMELDLGEVLTLPGQWSSYPAHRHPQPEIYHYRFTAIDGYGHAEIGEDVFRVSHSDTVKILDGAYHSQVAAPGYGMYYFYLSRDADGEAFENPIFEPAHSSVKDIDAAFWMPCGFERGSLTVDATDSDHAWSGEKAAYWLPGTKSDKR